MRLEILSAKQRELLPLLGRFHSRFGLVGGTAIALHLGHRRSIDFDLFTNFRFDNGDVRKRIVEKYGVDRTILDEEGQYTIIVNGVRITFLKYPFKLAFSRNLGETIKLPDVLTLAAMKAYALGRRAKWKDYVDLYFIFEKYGGLAPAVKRARKIFGKEFNEKLFRSQLVYFKDVDFSEEVIFSPGFRTSKEEIKKALEEFSIKG